MSMSSPAPGEANTVRLAPWSRLHRALMPDYNRKATVYWWLAVLCGLVLGSAHAAAGGSAAQGQPWAAARL